MGANNLDKSFDRYHWSVTMKANREDNESDPVA